VHYHLVVLRIDCFFFVGFLAYDFWASLEKKWGHSMILCVLNSTLKIYENKHKAEG
jgi:hypothetical protein